MRLLIFFAGVFFSVVAFSQNKVNGIITDSASGKPLAFVNVIANNSNAGVASDIDGKFTLQLYDKITEIHLSYIGYQSKTVHVSSAYVEITMTKNPISLQEVVIVPGHNPAHRIIKKAVDTKDLHHPDKMQEYRCNVYNKIVYTADRNKLIEQNNKEEKPDSSAIKMANFLQNHHLLLIESYTEKKKLAPDKEKETIISSRVSGLKAPSFTALATDVQPFSFYDNYITLLDKTYLNPLSKGSWNNYLFVLEDTTYTETDTTFIISFTKKKGANFDALKGVLYVNTNGYAIQNVIAEPFYGSLNKTKVQQKYSLINNKHWFPTQLNFNWNISEYGLQVIGKSYISNVDISPGLSNKDFNELNIEMADDATKNADDFFEKIRRDSLTEIENNTYHYMDSVGMEKNLDKKMQTIESLASGSIPVTLLDVKINSIYSYNDFEGHRIGLGTETNKKLAQWIKLGGYFAWGTRDQLWKYGGDITLEPYKRASLKINFNYLYDVEEPGNINYIDSKQIGSNSRLKTLLASRMNRDEKYSGTGSLRILRYFLIAFGFSTAKKNILSDYRYAISNNEDITINLNRMNFTQASIKMKFAYKERFAKVFNRRVSLGTNYPIIWFNYERGIKGLLNGFFDYERISVRASETFRLKRLGEITLMAEAGKVLGEVPATHLFFGKASFTNSLLLQVDNTFQTMRLYEFLNDRFIQFFYQHNLGKIHFKTERVNPEFLLVQNIGFGVISNSRRHQSITFKSMEKGYYESGILIKDLVRFNYLDVAWLGTGIGAYYRYGPYSLQESKDNFTARISLTFTL